MQEISQRLEKLLPKLYAVAFNILGQQADAEDAVQESCQRLFGRLARGRLVGDFQPYLYRILFNLCVDMQRRRKSLSLEGLPEQAAPPAHECGDPELEACLSQLAVKEKIALDLFYREGLAIKEMAQLFGEKEGTVRTRLHRARRKLRSLLQRKGEIHV